VLLLSVRSCWWSVTNASGGKGRPGDRVGVSYTFQLHGVGGEHGSITIFAPKQWWRRWLLYVAMHLWRLAAKNDGEPSLILPAERRPKARTRPTGPTLSMMLADPNRYPACVHPGCGLPDLLHGAPDTSRITSSDHWFRAPTDSTGVAE
jgi:hypothetical protein